MPPIRLRPNRTIHLPYIALIPLACAGCADQGEEPRQTAPFLVAAMASPDIRNPIVVRTGQFVEFGGAVLSEDTGVGVQIVLLLDYGHPNAAGLPYRNRIYPFEPIPSGTLADGPRPFQRKKWFLDSVPPTPGCHTLTMMASHEFDASACPVDLADSSFLVWQVLVCDRDGGPCPPECQPQACPDPCPSCATLDEAVP